jgi:K+-sensing histidine kinase KdpD
MGEKISKKTAEKGPLRLARELYAFTEVAKSLTSPLELHELLNVAIKKIIDVIKQADIGLIMLWDQSAGVFRAEAAYGVDFTRIKKMGLRAGESISGKTFDGGQPILLKTPAEVAAAMSDMRAFNRKVFAQSLGTPDLPGCTLAVPISAGEKKFGVLLLGTLGRHKPFIEQDLPFVQTIAELIALTIDRAQLETKAAEVSEARQLEHMRSEIMATLSHELRHPLSAIKGYSSALLLDEVDWSEEKQKEFLHLIEKESDTMEMMIAEILDSAIIDVEQLTMDREPVRLPKIARDVAQETQIRVKSHRLIVDFPSDFPIVDADQRWIKQVFRNLIDNAVKYSPEGGLIVIRGVVRLTDILISIADQGIGVSPEDLIPLFEKYYRVKSRSGVQVPGTGLGLPIARFIVESHGGRIWAESKIGEGTTIFFTLPLKSATMSPEK